jgi:hypothetical protein
LVAEAGTHFISVANPSSSPSGSVAFTVLNPVPTLVNVAPSSLLAATQQTATLSGTGFNSQSQVLYRGSTNGVTILGISPGGSAQTIGSGWGLNGSGQTTLPVLPSGKSFVQIAAGANHSLGRLNDGTVVAWGYNGNGQCIVPPLPTGMTYTDVAAGHFQFARTT